MPFSFQGDDALKKRRKRRGKWEDAGRALCPRRACGEDVPTLDEDHGNEETL